METLKKNNKNVGKMGNNGISFTHIIRRSRQLSFQERVELFRKNVGGLPQMQDRYYFREILTEPDREVLVKDATGHIQRMLMFGSNNYLGLANHPYVKEKVIQSISTCGVGVGGPSMLNGYTRSMQKLEERLSALKNTESTLIFSIRCEH